MTSSNDRGLSYETVKAVCELLKRNGYVPENISLRDIREETSAGSLTTIRRHRDRWLVELRDAICIPVDIEEKDFDGLRLAVTDLVAKKTFDLRAEFEISATANRALIERCELDFEEALRCNEKLQKARDDAVSHAVERDKALTAANLRADELAAANASLRGLPRVRIRDDRPVQVIPPEIVEDEVVEASAVSEGGE